MHPTTVLARIFAGGPGRKSRLHDERGNIVPLERLVRNGPRALVSGLSRLGFGIRPARPWISYDAQRRIAKHLSKSSNVLEFGSGMSTIWYGEHSGSVFSIEDNEEWFARMERQLGSRSNITYRFARDLQEYLSFPRKGYDLIMVDGSFRKECVVASLPYLASGGIIYLDNSDKNNGGDCGDVPAAEKALLDFAEQEGAEVRYFTDFATTQLYVGQGLLVRSPK